MGRYDEILERNKAPEDMEEWEEEWEEIVRLHGEAMEDGEEYFLVCGGEHVWGFGVRSTPSVPCFIFSHTYSFING